MRMPNKSADSSREKVQSGGFSGLPDGSNRRLFPPKAPAHIEIGQGGNGNGINKLAEPTYGQTATEMEDGHEDVDRINQKTDRLHRERGLGVSRARYGMETQLGGDTEDV